VHIADDLRNLQNRYDDVIRVNEGRLRDLTYESRHQKRALRGAVICKALERIA